MTGCNAAPSGHLNGSSGPKATIGAVLFRLGGTRTTRSAKKNKVVTPGQRTPTEVSTIPPKTELLDASKLGAITGVYP
jgi:hypothetical protein